MRNMGSISATHIPLLCRKYATRKERPPGLIPSCPASRVRTSTAFFKTEDDMMKVAGFTSF